MTVCSVVRIRAALTVFFVIALASVVVAEPADEAVAPQGVREKKTCDRWPDPVVADCGLLSSLVGKKIEFVRMYAFSDGVFGPIPFQIDEKDTQGNKIFPDGESANPQDANGLVDKGEELVFMVRDSGDRISKDVFPQGVEAWEELELEDPLTKGKGWVYLLYSESNPPPLSTEDYIVYEPKQKCPGEGDCQVMKSKYMEDHFYPMSPYFDVKSYDNIGFAHQFMATLPEAGGTHTDYVDRLKGRVTMAFLFGLLKFRVDESSVNFHEAAYKDGPVRLVRNIQIIINLPLGMKAPGIAVDLLWYDTIVDVPMVIDLPFNPGYLYTYMQLVVAEDHAPGAIGMKVYNSNNLEGFVVDGRTSPQEDDRWNNERDTWRLLTGPQGTTMNRSFWDQDYLKQMEWVKVDYIDDIHRKDPPESEPGELGVIAQTNRVEGIKKARYYSYLEWYWPPSFLFSGPGETFRVGDEKHYLNIADHPVRLKVGPNTMENHYFGQMPAYEQAEQIMEKKRESVEPLEKK